MADGAVALFRIYELPWSTGLEDEQKFRKIVQTALASALVLALLFWILPAPQPDPAEVVEVPKRIVRLVLEREAPPPPPPVVREEPKPEPAPEPVVQEREVEPPKPDPKPEPIPEPKPVDRTQQARERASVAGLLPFANQLAALREDTAESLDRAEVSAPSRATRRSRSVR